jgi:hypothetical protein
MNRPKYRVCNRLLDPETNEHCEFDGNVAVSVDGSWRCPSCHAKRWSA